MDLETIDRFRGVLEDDVHPMPFVFSQKEVAHARSQRDAALTLAACFTAKEALSKALSEPYNFTDCELFPVFEGEERGFVGEVSILKTLKEDRGELRAVAKCAAGRELEGEILTTVILFREEQP